MNPWRLNKYENMKFFGNYYFRWWENKKWKYTGNLFITNKILSVIMTCLNSSNLWHLKITKLGDNLYIDKMENSEIDLMRVNEIDNTPIDEDD